jgi:catechol 2,3-dioxygenase-like lactoylglutathione lyase family enzyme
MSASIMGIHHLKIPVSDLARSRAWYEKVFGLTVEFEFPDGDGVVRGLAGRIGGIPVALRQNPDAAQGISGFDPICFAIADRAAAEAWMAHLDQQDAEHSGIHEATTGWMVQVHDPDGIAIRLYSTKDEVDHIGEAGFPTRVNDGG